MYILEQVVNMQYWFCIVRDSNTIIVGGSSVWTLLMTVAGVAEFGLDLSLESQLYS